MCLVPVVDSSSSKEEFWIVMSENNPAGLGGKRFARFSSSRIQVDIQDAAYLPSEQCFSDPDPLCRIKCEHL